MQKHDLRLTGSKMNKLGFNTSVGRLGLTSNAKAWDQMLGNYLRS